MRTIPALLLLSTLLPAQGGDPWERMRRFDLDGDGKVAREEFGGPARAFERFDADGDGFVTEAEVRRARRGGAAGPGAIRQAFDLDRDGQVTAEEWTEFFRKADENGDEILQPEELQSALFGQPFRDDAPKVGDPAPAVRAQRLDGSGEVDLSKPRRATVLVFGSWT